MPDPALEDIRIIQGTDWTKPYRLLLDDGSLLDTTGYTARMKVRSDAESSTVLLDASTSNSRMQVGFDPAKRANSTAYGVGQQIVPTTLNGFVYECTAAGTSGGSAPAYSTTLGATFTDGSVTWIVKTSDTRVSNVRIVLTPAITSPLADWGLGVYDVELIDTFGHVLRFIEGMAVLSREITR